MIVRYLKWLQFAILASLLVSPVVAVCSLLLIPKAPQVITWLLWAIVVLAVVAVSLGYIISEKIVKAVAAPFEAEAEGQAAFLDRISERWLPAAIVTSAAVSLLLELAVIRWQGSVFEFFAYYKNFSLLACFGGLGLGYALSKGRPIPLFCTIPLLALQMGLLILLRFGLGALNESLLTMPFKEEVAIVFAHHETGPLNFIAIYCFLGVTFLTTTLAFMPVGQLCGRLLTRMEPLRAYGLNLVGSILGIAVMMLLSLSWTPPEIWFAVTFLGCLPFLSYDRRQLFTGAAGSLVALIILSLPVHFLSELIYSPYQLLERTSGKHGWSMIRAAGQYYQRILDLSPQAVVAYPELERSAAYYNLAFKAVPKVGEVAIVGAGSGNDVAAALRGGATRVDAVELDPAIIALGEEYHPEKPYQDKRVTPVVDDARSFMKTTPRFYDTIVMGLLDSHTMVSQASALRVDSYVYTVEALRDARRRLKDGGTLSLSFSVYDPNLARKLYQMMTQAFDGKPPVAVTAKVEGYDSAVTFLQNKGGDFILPAALLEKEHLRDISAVLALPAVSPATDDWPFLYMHERVFPVSYLPVAVMVIALSAAMFNSLYRQRPEKSALPFAFLGAGFMLIETKAITELGLHFGNTWAVNGIVIGTILLMAFLSNLAVMKFNIRNLVVPFLGLLLSIGLGLYFAYSGGFPGDFSGKILASIVMTLPILFSGIVFSCLLKQHGNIDSALFMNLLGAMVGGLLEYNSMYFGYRALYVMALIIYVLALLLSLSKKPANVEIPEGP